MLDGPHPVLTSIWATLGTYCDQWRAGCRPFHSWRPPGEFQTAASNPFYRGALVTDAKLFGGIRQCRRCGAIRSSSLRRPR